MKKILIVETKCSECKRKAVCAMPESLENGLHCFLCQGDLEVTKILDRI